MSSEEKKLCAVFHEEYIYKVFFRKWKKPPDKIQIIDKFLNRKMNTKIEW